MGNMMGAHWEHNENTLGMRENDPSPSTPLVTHQLPCVFLGYCERIKAYRLMCVETKKDPQESRCCVP